MQAQMNMILMNNWKGVDIQQVFCYFAGLDHDNREIFIDGVVAGKSFQGIIDDVDAEEQRLDDEYWDESDAEREILPGI